MNKRPGAVVVGFVAKIPLAGMALYNLHYIVGLQELGYEVHYLERVDRSGECYDPEVDTMGDEARYGLRWLDACMGSLPGPAVPWTFIDLAGEVHGAGLKGLCQALDRADFVLTIAVPTWLDELERCPRRAFIDGDPLFTQAAMLDATGSTAATLARYPTLFTYWTRQGAADTTVPTAGRDWISTTPVVATALWDVAPPRPSAPITTVMNWSAWGEVDVDGRGYGQKSRVMEYLIDLPSLTSHELLLAVGGPAPKKRLLSRGWKLANPLSVTRTIGAYREFIVGSYADLGIAKHAYVASRSGWFSDRSLCYMASGRPVLHQDTGFTDWLPAGEGVLSFSTVQEVIDGLRELTMDYPRHALAARTLAETCFEARTVIGRMLDDAGFR